MRRIIPFLLIALLIITLGCDDAPEPTSAPEPEAPAAEPAEPPVPKVTLRDRMRNRALQVFGILPDSAPSEVNESTEEKITLGRMLFFDPRLSKNHDISCNSCHGLASYGVDGEATSPGHQGQRGDRNSPTVYNAALHVAQFWDGRSPDVEDQAKGPVLNPIEMAMPSEEATVTVLKSVPGYAALFADAFPDDEDPITYDNMARAIGAFERGLITADRFDAFASGQDEALSDDELAGLSVFMSTGCITCHSGPTIGGNLYRKLGLVRPYETEDPGRVNVTNDEADRSVFKVPSLRNIAMTGPYFHDGSVESLNEAIRLMGSHQLGIDLADHQVASIAAFLGTLTGTVDPEYIDEPQLPESGPDTPAPDPN
ncbi:MAG: c-type cytochrome [Deltaproteobacteria bacterium]|nr:c-type cytochrome [Deltaproteobacteria bacterium]